MHFWDCGTFFLPIGYPINSIFQWKYILIRFMFLMKHFFFFTIGMPMVTKLFRVVTYCEELSPINMHDISTEWSCRGTWQIKHISPPLVWYWHHIKEGADLVLEAPKHDPLIKWPTWDHVTVKKIFISLFIANKFGRLLALEWIFSTQMLKSSPLLLFLRLRVTQKSFAIAIIAFACNTISWRKLLFNNC